MKVLCVPGAATLELILGVVSGAGTKTQLDLAQQIFADSAIGGEQDIASGASAPNLTVAPGEYPNSAVNSQLNRTAEVEEAF